ncbi:MAG: ABC transporter ATP-binding protein [Candidatus Muirbacterium halophilum]|nr:ABC transporter ATP-binding protein [Candidatus Muirbacterium halophilum]MCK9476647.1 ABC transporter ATP-binding protein [Candidatus Muirbacterium halophilum]
MNDIIFEVKSLSKRFGNSIILDNISFSLKKGEIVAYLGHNGAGKTTTIRCMTGLLNPEGKLFFFGEEVDFSGEIDSKKLGKIGVCLDSHGFYENLSAIKNLEIYSVLYGMNDKDFYNNSKKYLKKFDLIDFMNKPVKTFSKGMKQKLSLIKSIQHNPELLILDEPFSGVDPQMRINIREILLELKEKGITIFTTSHDLGETQKIADKIMIIEKGKIIVNRMKKELLEGDGISYELKYINENNYDMKTIVDSLKFLSVTLNEKENMLIINSEREIYFDEIYKIMAEKIKIKEFNRVEHSLENIYFQSIKNNEH